MILVPATSGSLDAGDLERIVLHESAHLQATTTGSTRSSRSSARCSSSSRRCTSRAAGIDFEREVACDDRVLEDAGEPLRYAECLARIVQLQCAGRRRGRPRFRAATGAGARARPAHRPLLARRLADLRPAPRSSAAPMLIATLGIARLQVPVVAAASAMHMAAAVSGCARDVRTVPALRTMRRR